MTGHCLSSTWKVIINLGLHLSGTELVVWEAIASIDAELNQDVKQGNNTIH